MIYFTNKLNESEPFIISRMDILLYDFVSRSSQNVEIVIVSRNAENNHFFIFLLYMSPHTSVFNHY